MANGTAPQRRPVAYGAQVSIKCTDLGRSGRGRDGQVRLLVGVMTGPTNLKRRDAVRQTWMQYPSVGKSIVVCFAIGRWQLENATLARLDAEAALHGDLLLLPISDGCVKQVSIGKMYAFWREAARLLSQWHGAPPLIVKTDDDSFVNLPLLETTLRPLRCVPRLYFGAVVFTGYQPTGFQNCGFGWGGSGSFYKYGCSRGGAHPPFPFVLGQLQVLSVNLLDALAASPDAVEFAAAAEAAIDTLANEDSALGFMVSTLPEVSYVGMRTRAWHNLGCFSDGGMYRPPHMNSTMVVHRILTVAAMYAIPPHGRLRVGVRFRARFGVGFGLRFGVRFEVRFEVRGGMRFGVRGGMRFGVRGGVWDEVWDEGWDEV